MIEHPQFFWYKRYVAWSELLTIVGLCEELSFAWKEQFTPHQVEYLEERVMSAKVLDFGSRRTTAKSTRSGNFQSGYFSNDITVQYSHVRPK